MIDHAFLFGISGLEQKLQSFCLAQKDFNMVIGGPSMHDNQMIYLSVLPGLVSILHENLSAYLKITQREKVYRPHLTLMRASHAPKLNMNKMLTDAKRLFFDPYSFTVNGIELYARQKNEPFKRTAVIGFTGK